MDSFTLKAETTSDGEIVLSLEDAEDFCFGVWRFKRDGEMVLHGTTLI